MPRTEVFYVGVVNMIAARALAAESVIKMTVYVDKDPRSSQLLLIVFLNVAQIEDFMLSWRFRGLSQ